MKRILYILLAICFIIACVFAMWGLSEETTEKVKNNCPPAFKF